MEIASCQLGTGVIYTYSVILSTLRLLPRPSESPGGVHNAKDFLFLCRCLRGGFVDSSLDRSESMADRMHELFMYAPISGLIPRHIFSYRLAIGSRQAVTISNSGRKQRWDRKWFVVGTIRYMMGAYILPVFKITFQVSSIYTTSGTTFFAIDCVEPMIQEASLLCLTRLLCHDDKLWIAARNALFGLLVSIVDGPVHLLSFFNARCTRCLLLHH